LPSTRYSQAMGIAAALEGGLVIIFSGIDALVPALFFLTGAYAARGFCVTVYTAALMHTVDEAVRGKVFVFERVASSAVMVLATMACSWALGIFTPQTLALVTGCFLLLNGSLRLLRSQGRMEAPALSGAEKGG
ncbi:MAG: MFS transporter, partial [Nitrospirales bacterium]|nr:MFS transporter [Nitrospirales bacterium]